MTCRAVAQDRGELCFARLDPAPVLDLHSGDVAVTVIVALR